MQTIEQFRGKYYFLSNYYPCDIVIDDITFKNAEAAFHAEKCPARRREFSELNPSEAKRFGRSVSLRSDWETIKDSIMLKVVDAKFSENKDLRERLLDTGDADLIEGNTWHDTYWGMYNGEGKNKLGDILMGLRYIYTLEDKIDQYMNDIVHVKQLLSNEL